MVVKRWRLSSVINFGVAPTDVTLENTVHDIFTQYIALLVPDDCLNDRSPSVLSSPPYGVL